MKTGDMVLITGRVWTTNPVHDNSTALYEATYREPRRALLLGKSKRFTGTRQGGLDEPTYLVVGESHDVWMVMEMASHNRYRRPIPVLETQIQEATDD